ncbi:unnamed protein product [Schistosoma margrebowiei]|uniref:Uncharacterized protein n=1 Tax=Schistosoma margrebowiei TaxID=48269 RepID=A0A183LN14_9TREM|nr:unnamed protein product [Schistosoma margrebowiei]
MVVGGSRQETLDPGFVLFGTRQQGVPVILRELVLPGGFDLVSINCNYISVLQEVSHGSDSSVVTSLTVKLGDQSIVTIKDYILCIDRIIVRKAS